ncbi:M23 family metallopeptidase [Streptomyces sp. NPDC090994]|uniref:M23 family metallopeptidase n=1 Tax=Streptomyces sp. NPDC090994 TaxID=3365969 RepID=UPI003828EFE7
MNDRHPSGTPTAPAAASEAASAHYASYGIQEAQYGDLTTYNGYDTTGFAADPLFGDLPDQNTGAYETAPYAAATTAAAAATATYDTTGAYTAYDTTGTYDTTQWTGSHQTLDTGGHQTLDTGSHHTLDTGGHPLLDTGGHQTLNYDAYAAQHHAAYDTGAFDTATWADGCQPLPTVPPQPGAPDTSGQWDSTAWLQTDQLAQIDQIDQIDQSGAPASAPAPVDPADQTQQWDWGTQTFDTGAYDATQWNTDGTPTHDGTAQDTPQNHPQNHPQSDPHDAGPDHGLAATGELPTVAPLLEEEEENTPAADASQAPGTRAAARAASRSGSRSRRRQPAKRSALLTIAVPSACVMGVAGIAAASVDGLNGDGDKENTASASDTRTQAVKPSAANNKLDTQLASLSAGADDFADRASRTQERIDLKAEQAAEKKRAAQEAARKERLRPKFALPVAQHGLSAYYGQSGINWMSVHSGIDFPVSYGTTVMAATDGTVRTQYNSAYGNMMIVTAKDGTETWYCHLSSYQVASGTTVKAGDAIAYSGNSGNSTGPHLHFEVRPSGGSAIDPLAWLRSHDLDPT